MALALITGGTRFLLPAGAQADPTTVELAARNDSGVSGAAQLEATEGATWIRISVEGGRGDLIAYLRRGDCRAYLEQPAIPLALTTPGVESKTAVDVPLEELVAGGYLIALHAADGDLATLLDPEASAACGEISGADEEPSAAAAMQPPVTGIGPMQSGRDWMLMVASTLAMVSLGLAVTCLRNAPQSVDAPVVINVVAMHRLRGLTK
jgi:hypothetical protein